MQRRQFLRISMSPILTLPIIAQSDPWSASELIEPDVFAETVKSGTAPRILYIGFPILYKGAHIAGAQLAGPCSKAEGIALLRNSANALPRDQELVIYCGCCPFNQCPNIRPAYSALHQMGFTKLKVLHLATNLHSDWTTKGYPVQKAA